MVYPSTRRSYNKIYFVNVPLLVVGVQYQVCCLPVLATIGDGDGWGCITPSSYCHVTRHLLAKQFRTLISILLLTELRFCCCCFSSVRFVFFIHIDCVIIMHFGSTRKLHEINKRQLFQFWTEQHF